MDKASNQIEPQYREEAERFSKVIIALANHPELLEGLESYLSRHFESWLKRYANTPEDLVSELEHFARIDHE